MTIPQSTDILLSSIVAVGGSGFDAGVLPGSLAVVLFAGWMMKGAPTNQRTDKGFHFAWVLVGAVVLWGLFGCSVAGAGLIGNALEADGDRAIKEAKADRIRAENEIARLRAALDAERQRAMMRAAGHAPPSAPAETETDRFVALLIFAVAVGAVGLYWMELRKREAKEAEIRELQVQLAIAERRAADRPLLPQTGALSLADGQSAGGSRCG